MRKGCWGWRKFHFASVYAEEICKVNLFSVKFHCLPFLSSTFLSGGSSVSFSSFGAHDTTALAKKLRQPRARGRRVICRASVHAPMFISISWPGYTG